MKLSSMYLTDAIFFSLIIFFYYSKLRKRKIASTLFGTVATFFRFEGLILLFINLAHSFLKRERKLFIFNLLTIIFLLPIAIQGSMLYNEAHINAIPEASYFLYLLTPFLINGVFLPFGLISLIKFWKRNIFLTLIFFIFTFFYLCFKVGGTFADRFRYVLPTLLPSAFYCSLYFRSRRKRKIFLILLFLNSLLLIPLYDYYWFKMSLKELLFMFK